VKDSPAVAASPALSAIAARRTSSLLADYVALTKPRLNFLVVVTSAAGFYLGAAGAIDVVSMLVAAIGTALVAGGAAVLNQVSERDTDALMRRTRLRPLPDGRVSIGEARMLGLLMAAAGLGLLASRANPLSAALALTTLVIYLAVYTPMKRRTPAATIVGAIPGALPALIGWTASHGNIAAGGAALFVVVFLWQVPHFMAISWMYRDDYQMAGFPMLTVIDSNGRRAGRQAVLFAAALVPAAAAPSIIGVSGWMSGAIAVALGFALLGFAVEFARNRTDKSARHLFLGSIVYLPVLWIALVADKL
jgi:heme o synthase